MRRTHEDVSRNSSVARASGRGARPSARCNAAGQSSWGLVRGARADALVLDPRAPALLGIPASHTLDALVFAGSEPILLEVMVAGQVVMRDGHHAQEELIAERFAAVMHSLWAQL